MRFTLSRVSDEFMTVELPSPQYPPHHKAVWNNGIKDWVIEINSPEQLVELCSGMGIRLVVREVGNGVPHIEIDDVTQNH